MLRRIFTTALTLCLTAAVATTAQAQATCGATGGAGASCSPTGTFVTGTMQRIIFLSVTNPSFGLTMPTDVNFAGAGTATMTDLGAQAATVRANAAWTLTAQGAAWTGTGNTSKATGDMSWTTNGGGAYTPMTTSAATIASGTATAGATTNIGYRTLWSLATDGPGTYSQALTFTLTAP